LFVRADLVRDCGAKTNHRGRDPLLQANKKPGRAGFFDGLDLRLKALLDLGFLVHDVLANDRVEFLDFHLFRHVALVLGRGVVMTGAGAGDEFDFVTHAVFS
jgi:hypothetical protein